MRFPSSLLYFVLGLFLWMLLGCNNHGTSEKITIATAANMRYAIEDLAKVFTKETGIQCDLVISSSGTLTAQIKEGAPYDVFISADTKYPNDLFNSGLTTNPPKTYAYGKLVLWTLKKHTVPSISILSDNSIEHIAIANPKIAPYGKAATSVLNYYKLLDKIEDKLVYGESISQTNQFILSGSAELGFTSISVVLAPELKEKGTWIELDNHLYEPIAQSVVLITHKKANSNSAKKFYDFLFSKKAKEILKNFGYSVDE
ncbi:molybdate ABC transporter substrate-binding protein [Flagellimonas sp. HMM57]|uniref:molybdate ABC transporter substrate-binding protein n=1 Tax=unclassified Flagellimonas TaxID=2644544 RepID=UPI0013D74596|nr:MULTISPECIES: molybdate ABC transporter substrate-binding protein [unclassified Flagellimonas]UII74872.1 molybdate ABC transporter substrate-binding protein [Flagellimonas sp. HMM57]